jgi:hypothetical protein
MTHINGPVNVVRLEGQIFNIKKIIYIYFDHHSDLYIQTKCNDFISDDIVVYLNKEFSKIENKYIDFFMETTIEQQDLFLSKIYKKDRYIDEINKFFMANILLKNNKNVGTKINKNIRFHYVDIRNEFKLNFYKIFDNIKKNIKNGSNNLYEEYKKLIDEINNKLNELTKILKNNGNKMIEKIKLKYNHPEIKEKINNLLNNLYDYIDILKKNIININNLEEIDTQYIELIKLYAWLMDIYFLRRFLDKDYITNAIIYCGVGHALRYIIFLIKEFDFNITHASYLSKPLTLINEIIKKSDINDIENIKSLFIKDNYIQCINVTSFPDNFS